MWLDRFSTHSTPSATPPPQRSYSPAPTRRPYLTPGPLPARPGLTPRSSSLSLISPTSSTASLPTTARVPNGSQLRRQIAPTPSDVPDPLDVLEKIIGRPPKRIPSDEAEQTQNVVAEKPAEPVEDIEFGGLSLSAFAQGSKGPETSNVHNYSAQSVEECTLFLPLLFPSYAHSPCVRR